MGGQPESEPHTPKAKGQLPKAKGSYPASKKGVVEGGLQKRREEAAAIKGEPPLVGGPASSSNNNYNKNFTNKNGAPYNKGGSKNAAAIANSINNDGIFTSKDGEPYNSYPIKGGMPRRIRDYSPYTKGTPVASISYQKGQMMQNQRVTITTPGKGPIITLGAADSIIPLTPGPRVFETNTPPRDRMGNLLVPKANALLLIPVDNINTNTNTTQNNTNTTQNNDAVEPRAHLIPPPAQAARPLTDYDRTRRQRQNNGDNPHNVGPEDLESSRREFDLLRVNELRRRNIPIDLPAEYSKHSDYLDGYNPTDANYMSESYDSVIEAKKCINLIKEDIYDSKFYNPDSFELLQTRNEMCRAIENLEAAKRAIDLQRFHENKVEADEATLPKFPSQNPMAWYPTEAMRASDGNVIGH